VRLADELVARECAAWVFVPEGAVTVETPEYLLVRMPPWFEIPLELLRFDPRRQVEVVVDEVLDRARALAATGVSCADVNCWVKLHNDPSLDHVFQGVGGVLDETLDVLALDLAGGAPALDSAQEVDLRWVTDIDTARDEQVVDVEVFGSSMPPDEELASAAERGRRDVAAGSGSVVAYLDGVPVGTGGLSLVAGVARLWGGAVREQARGRGVYRALLGARIRFAVQHGATMALVKGRVQTSGPILRRAGFERYGEERSYRVPLH
jgi:GNAT superfamily N-acetyltransferase